MVWLCAVGVGGRKGCVRGGEQVSERIGEETIWQIGYIPGHFHRIEHVRIKCACRRCETGAQNAQITLADKPAQPIDKGMAGPGILAYVATSKYAGFLPLYRLEGIFARNGLQIDRGHSLQPHQHMSAARDRSPVVLHAAADGPAGLADEPD